MKKKIGSIVVVFMFVLGSFMGFLNYGSENVSAATILGHDTPRVYPTPVADDFEFTVNSFDHAVVGIKGPSAASYNLDVYPDNSFIIPIQSSTAAFGIGFVTLDKTVWASPPNRGARVSPAMGTGNYTIEMENDVLDYLVTDNWRGTMEAKQDGIEVFDAYSLSGATIGNTYTINLTVPLLADLDLYLFDFFGDDAQAKEEAPWSSTSIGAGVDESITFTATITGDYLLVITNQNGGTGVYTVNYPPDTLYVEGWNRAPLTAEQGSTALMLQLNLTSNTTGNGRVRLNSIAINQTGVPPAPGDIDAVELWIDTDGDDNFEPWGPDMRIGVGVPPFPITFITMMTINHLSPQQFFVVYNISGTATPGNWVGAALNSNLNINVSGFDLVSNANFPIDTYVPGVKTAIAAAAANVLTVNGTDKAPATVAQGDDALILNMTLIADSYSINVTSIKLDLTGTAVDSDISAVQLYLDTNDNGYFEFIESINLMARIASGKFVGGTTTLTPSYPITVLAGSPERLLIVFVFSCSATPTNTAGVTLVDNSYITVSAPDTVSSANFPISSANSEINSATNDVLTVTGTDKAPVNLQQGETYVVMEQLELTASSNSVSVSTIRVDLNGTGGDPDIKYAYLVHDVNNNGIFDQGFDGIHSTTTFSSKILTFNLTIMPFIVRTGTTENYLIMYDIDRMATTGNTVGANLSANTYVGVGCGDTVSGATFPIQSTNSLITATTAEILTVTGTDKAPATVENYTWAIMYQLALSASANSITVDSITIDLTGSGVNEDLDMIGLVHDYNNDGNYDAGYDNFIGSIEVFAGWTKGFATFYTTFKVESGTPENLLIVFGISRTAGIGNTVGLELANYTYITTLGDLVSSSGFPMTSGLTQINSYVPNIINSDWKTTTPAIDGLISAGEWTDATVVDLSPLLVNMLPAFMLVKNDDTNLYVAMDSVFDYTDGEDFSELLFETSNDALPTDGKEDIFSLGNNSFYNNPFGQRHAVWNSSENDWITHDEPFNTILPDHGTLAGAWNFGISPYSITDHRMFEFRIPLALLDVLPGETIGFMSAVTDFDVGTYRLGPNSDWPLFFPWTWECWVDMLYFYGDLILASSPGDSPPTIDAYEPGGTVGQTYTQGDLINVTWNATDDNPLSFFPINITYGVFPIWTTIVTLEPNDGLYSWNTSAVPCPGTYWMNISVYDSIGQTTFDEGNFSFNISCPVDNPPIIEAWEPGGSMGQSHTEGTFVQVTWNATDDNPLPANPINITYGIPGSWTTITTGQANDGIYLWDTTGVACPAVYWMNLTVYDSIGQETYDLSNNSFTMFCPGDNPPLLNVYQPGGSMGLTYTQGDIINVTWNAIDDNPLPVLPINITYGVSPTWTPIANDEANDGYYSWNTSAVPCPGTYWMNLSVYDSIGQTTFDESNYSFTILCPGDTPPQITVYEPGDTSGQTYTEGDIVNITWFADDDNALPPTPINLTYGTPSFWTVISLNEPNTGIFNWDTAFVPCPGEYFMNLTVYDSIGQETYDWSNFTFKIDCVDLPPVIDVFEPGGTADQIYIQGDMIMVTWMTSDDNPLPLNSINITYGNEPTWTTIATNEVNDGVYLWDTTGVPCPSAYWMNLTVYDTIGQTAYGWSDFNFTINCVDLPPTIETWEPGGSGGQTIIKGDMVTVTWNASDDLLLPSTPINITYGSGAAWTTIASNEANDGTYDWDTSTAICPGIYSMNISVYDSAGQTTFDESNFTFFLDCPPDDPPTIEVYEPGGTAGQIYIQGNPIDIIWTTSDDNSV